MKRKLLRLPVYPFLLAAYPVLALLLYNLSEVRATAAIRPILVSILAVFIIFFLFRLLFGDWHRSAFATFCLVLLFFTYGHVYDLLLKKLPSLPRDPWLWILWSALGLLCLLWAAWKKSRFEKTTLILNIVSLGLLIFVIAQVVIYNPPNPVNEPSDEFAPMKELSIPADKTPPDIYYIIIDSYGRYDLLNRAFNYDNSQFLQNLRELGFYIADCAQSNYNRTDVSLASSLNLDYLQNLSSEYLPPNQSRRKLWASIDTSTVRIMLENAGYTSVAFTTGFAWSEVDSSDVFLAPDSIGLSLTSFEVLLLRTTPALYLEKFGLINLTELDGQYFRERTLYILDSMEDLAHRDEPTFAFIHILPPHPPFVFAPDGSFIDPAPFLNEEGRYTSDSYKRGYRSQVEYITGQVEIAVKTLLAESSTPPIIILQGDHAPWLQTGNGKFLILNAYYFPGQSDVLYSTISPVNSFRMVFNNYFGTDYELLPDTSYYSPIPNIYEFEEFPNPCLDQ
jgi:hypothetical protein